MMNNIASQVELSIAESQLRQRLLFFKLHSKDREMGENWWIREQYKKRRPQSNQIVRQVKFL